MGAVAAAEGAKEATEVDLMTEGEDMEVKEVETGAIEEEVVMVTGVEEVVEEAGVGEMMVAGVAEMTEVGVVEMTEEEEGEDMEEVVEVGMEETGEDLQDKTIFGNQQQRN